MRQGRDEGETAGRTNGTSKSIGAQGIEWFWVIGFVAT